MDCTVESIARRVGCSVATVSRVLNNSAPVSAKARSAVLDAVRESGSVPKVLGRRARKSHQSIRRAPRDHASGSTDANLVEILMLVRHARPTIKLGEDGAVAIDHDGALPVSSFFSASGRYANSYYRHIVDGAISELNRIGMRAVLQVADALAAPSLVQEVNSKSNSGLIVLGDYFDDYEAFLNKVECPVVSLVSWDFSGWPDYIGIDNQLGIRRAFEHVHSLGHRRIGYIAGDTVRTAVFRERKAAFEVCLAQAGLMTDCGQWIEGGSTVAESMEAAANKMLSSADRPTAILCCFDGAALAVKRAASKLGLTIPRDLSVVGFDDEEIGELFNPPLTTLRVPAAHMGRLAVQTLQLRRSLGATDRTEASSIRVLPKLIVRQSTGPVPLGVMDQPGV